jgi:hypothetical protein
LQLAEIVLPAQPPGRAEQWLMEGLRRRQNLARLLSHSRSPTFISIPVVYGVQGR